MPPSGFVFLDDAYRSLDAIEAQSGRECRGLPMAMRDFADQTLAARRPAVKPCHVGSRETVLRKIALEGVAIVSATTAYAATDRN
jgi:hypothetical protein